MRLGIATLIMTFFLTPAQADDGEYLLNFDLNTKLPAGVEDGHAVLTRYSKEEATRSA